MNYWKNRCDRAEIQPNGVGASIPLLVEVEALQELTELPQPVQDLLDRAHAITWRVLYGNGPFLVDTQELKEKETMLTVDHVGVHLFHRDTIDRLIGSFGPRPDTVVADPHIYKRASRESLKAIMQSPATAKARQMADEVHPKLQSMDYSILLGRALGISLLEQDLSEDSVHEILAAQQTAVLKVLKGKTYSHSHQAEKDSRVRELLIIGRGVPHFKAHDRRSSLLKPDDTLWAQSLRRS